MPRKPMDAFSRARFNFMAPDMEIEMEMMTRRLSS